MMVHNPSTIVYSNAYEMLEAAEILVNLGRSVARTHVARTGLRIATWTNFGRSTLG